MKCTIESQKKQATLSVQELVLYENCQLLHAQGRSGQDYYLIFHNKRYINTVKINHLNDQSFIAKVLKQGLRVRAPHHAIYALVNQQVFSVVPIEIMFNTLIGKAKQLEQIITLSYFDQFIPQDKITDLFIETFRSLRRDGKLQQAFEVLLLIKEYAPDNQFAQDILTTLTFQGYQSKNHLYQAFHPLDLDKLEKLYLENNDSFLLSILSTVRLLKHDSTENWELFYKTLSHYPSTIQTKTLFQLLKQNLDLIKNDTFVETTLKHATPKQYFSTIFQHNYPHTIDSEVFIKQFEKLDQVEHLKIFNMNQTDFINLIDQFPIPDKERLLRLIVESALPHISIDDILNWFEVFDKKPSFHRYLLMIKELIEDPDKQEKLAEYYLEFNQLDAAIECLKWEVELEPTNEQIYKKLIKLLKETDQSEEAKSYQQQWIQQTKYAIE